MKRTRILANKVFADFDMPHADPEVKKEYHRKYKKMWLSIPGNAEKQAIINAKWRKNNKNILSEKNKLYRKNNKEVLRNSRLITNYGLSIEDYNRMLFEQEGKCKICNESPKNSPLNVDHDHITGEVRGLLCSSCNRGIGYLKDSVEILQKAVEYLNKGGVCGL